MSISGAALIILLWGDTSGALARGSEELAAFRAEVALELLLQAVNEGPYSHADQLKLYEQLGVAYTYLERNEEALDAFDMLLALDPGYAISYTLSPKVTFVFEEARRRTAKRPKPTVHLSWPSDLRVTDPIDLDIHVVADPKQFLKNAVLHSRLQGEEAFEANELSLPALGEHAELQLPAAAPQREAGAVLELYLVAKDAQGNEVLLVGNPKQPRELALVYEEPEPWYRKWWVWAIVGGVVAVGTGIIVYLALNKPPDTVGGTFQGVVGFPIRFQTD